MDLWSKKERKCATTATFFVSKRKTCKERAWEINGELLLMYVIVLLLLMREIEGEANLRSPVSWHPYGRFSYHINIFFGNFLSLSDKNISENFFRKEEKF